MLSENLAQKQALDEGVELMSKQLAGRTDEVIDEIALLYAQQIPLEDLKAMTEFFKTPAGQRFVAMQPQLVQQQMEIGRRWGERVAIDAQRELHVYMRQRGFNQ
jgi:hypothetical protein